MELIEKIPPSLTSSMVVASLLFVVAVWLIIHLANRDWSTSLKIAAGLLSWYGLVFILGITGFFGMTTLFAPNIAFAFITLFFLLKFLYSNQTLQRVFERIPLYWVMGVQIFRVMGYGFLTFYSLGLLPGEFAIPTGWGDVFVGITAPIVAYLYFKKMSYSKNLAILWNWVGIADLTMAISLGIFTYPEPLQVIPTTVSNAPIALYPLVLVPIFAVPLSVLLHLFTLRVLKHSSS